MKNIKYLTLIILLALMNFGRISAIQIFHSVDSAVISHNLYQRMEVDDLQVEFYDMDSISTKIHELDGVVNFKFWDCTFSTFPDEFYDLESLKSITLVNCPNVNLEKLFYKLSLREKPCGVGIWGNGIESIDFTSLLIDNISGIEVGNMSFVKLPERMDQSDSLTGMYFHNIDTLIFPKYFGKDSKISYLTLAECNLESMPTSIFSLTNLRELNIHDPVQSIPDEISMLKSLETLNLGDCNIKYISDSLTSLLNLKELLLSHNNISSLPKHIGKLKNIVLLDCSYNKLSEIPRSIYQCDSLKRIDFNFNAISSLPANFEKLKVLNSLLLNFNDFKIFPQQICHMQRLEFISFYDNEIREIPSCIAQLRNLKLIILNMNPIYSLPESFYELLPRIEEIGLEINNLDDQTRDRFEKEFEGRILPDSSDWLK